jgi:outer membrane PBP1 activator LpoA protein
MPTIQNKQWMFAAADNRQEHAGSRPDVRFYDTQQADISTIYRKAVADDAQLVIGPLNKKFIKVCFRQV